MDPNAANLDPKLKEMYNRVMNTPVAPPPTGGMPPPPAPDPMQQPTPTSPTSPNSSDPTAGQQNPTPQMPVPSDPVAPPPPQPQEPTPPTSIPETPATTQMHAAIPMTTAPKPISAAIVGGSAKKKGMSIFPVILALGGIIFLVVYSVFWIKFFNLKIPFLPF